jgi:hypothetical protein
MLDINDIDLFIKKLKEVVDKATDWDSDSKPVLNPFQVNIS